MDQTFYSKCIDLKLSFHERLLLKNILYNIVTQQKHILQQMQFFITLKKLLKYSFATYNGNQPYF